MIRNYYFLIAGILAIIFAVTHALNGQSTVLPSLDIQETTAETKTVLFYVWHIITAENLILGIAFLIMAFHKDRSKIRFAALVIAILMIARWIVIFGATLLLYPAGLKNTLIDSIALAVYVSLILFGIRQKTSRQKYKYTG